MGHDAPLPVPTLPKSNSMTRPKAGIHRAAGNVLGVESPALHHRPLR
jgi:hypothetical protein